MNSVRNSVEVLGLQVDDDAIRDLTVEDVEAAYREQVKTVHPDQGGSVEQFKEVKQAYDILIDFVGSSEQSLYTTSANKTTNTTENIEDFMETGSRRASSAKSSTATSYTYQRRTKNNYKKRETYTTTFNEGFDNDVSDDYEKYYDNSIHTRIINKLSFIVGSYNLLLMFNIGILFLTLVTLFGHTVIAPFTGQITVKNLLTSYTITPVLILLDMRYNTLISIQLFRELSFEDVIKTADIDSVKKYPLWKKLLLCIVSFAGTTFFIGSLTQAGIGRLLAAQSIIVLGYVYSRRKIPTPSKARVKRESNK